LTGENLFPHWLVNENQAWLLVGSALTNQLWELPSLPELVVADFAAETTKKARSSCCRASFIILSELGRRIFVGSGQAVIFCSNL